MKSNDIIYQIFPRNYSPSGTLKAITNDLDRIKALGVNIIYLMPIHEIGLKERKGTYGSPYAIKDYFSISPDLGNIADLKELIKETHNRGMKIILDMVFNHTSPDNVLVNNHEDYYFHKDGKLGNRVGEWSDIIDLDTNKIETQQYLLSVLKYWVSLGIDGFRFDVASMIDFSFFLLAREALGKDIIFIGESIDYNFSNYLLSKGDKVTLDNDMYPTFNSLYNYNYFRELISYLKGEGKLDNVVKRINEDNLNLRLLCLENHDNDRIASLVNKSRLRNLLSFFAFIKGQAFIYMGQEYGNKIKPPLFEKDPVNLLDIDKEMYSLYLEFINNKIHQKEIIKEHLTLIDENTIKVNLTYIDKSQDEKIFYLG